MIIEYGYQSRLRASEASITDEAFRINAELLALLLAPALLKLLHRTCEDKQWLAFIEY
jgi:hypothetical protein